jgi:hypothetical protein
MSAIERGYDDADSGHARYACGRCEKQCMFTTGADFLLVHTPNILAFGKPHHQCHRIFRFSADPTFIIVVYKSTLL